MGYSRTQYQQDWMGELYMKLWGMIAFNPDRGHWCVRGKWQGKRLYFSQIPTAAGGFLPCKTEDMAKYLQIEISKEMAPGKVFNPARYKPSRPLHVESYSLKWLDLKRPNLDFSTWKGYRAYIVNWINPMLGDKYLPDLNHETIMEFLNGIDRSIKYKKNIYGCLYAMLNDARRSGYISQLPDHVTFSLPRKKIEWLSRSRQDDILREIPPRHRFIFKFLFLTGVRPSEARALRKKDIDGDHIVIARTFAPGPGKETSKIVKNKREQAIPLYAAVQTLLDEMPITLSPFVFVNPDTGKPYSKNINRDIWNPACMKVLGFIFPLNNAGRHSFANQMLEAGIDIETVSTLLRHSKTSVTKDSYARPNLKVIGGLVDRAQSK